MDGFIDGMPEHARAHDGHTSAHTDTYSPTHTHNTDTDKDTDTTQQTRARARTHTHTHRQTSMCMHIADPREACRSGGAWCSYG